MTPCLLLPMLSSLAAGPKTLFVSPLDRLENHVLETARKLGARSQRSGAGFQSVYILHSGDSCARPSGQGYQASWRVTKLTSPHILILCFLFIILKCSVCPTPQLSLIFCLLPHIFRPFRCFLNSTQFYVRCCQTFYDPP